MNFLLDCILRKCGYEVPRPPEVVVLVPCNIDQRVPMCTVCGKRTSITCDARGLLQKTRQ